MSTFVAYTVLSLECFLDRRGDINLYVDILHAARSYRRIRICSRAIFLIAFEAPPMPSIMLAGSVAFCPKSSLGPKPHGK
jgi:hypothetical protein